MSLINVNTEVTGLVWKIMVSEGEKVSEGNELLIMESMKMEIPIISPCDGVIKEIKVKEGDSLPEGEITVIIDK